MLSSSKLIDLRQIKGVCAVRSIFAISSFLNSRALFRLSLAMKSNIVFNSRSNLGLYFYYHCIIRAFSSSWLIVSNSPRLIASTSDNISVLIASSFLRAWTSSISPLPCSASSARAFSSSA